MYPHILITGSSGFLGSRTAVKLLNAGYKICGIDNRPSSSVLKDMAKKSQNKMTLINVDISNKETLSSEIQRYVNNHGNINYIVHFAAFWNYENKFIDKYQLNNIIGTQNMYNISIEHKMDKFIFASSVEALSHVISHDELLGHINVYKNLEADPKNIMHPYGWSKAVSENFLINNSIQESNPGVVILRIGGVFSDWCELPPLSWLINRWSGQSNGLIKTTTTIINNLSSRIIPGAGFTAIPFIHRDNLISLIETIIMKHELLDDWNIFMVTDADINRNENEHKNENEKFLISHNKLFELIRNEFNLPNNPIRINKNIVKCGLQMEKLFGLDPPEQLWMFNLIDKELIDMNNVYKSNKILNWTPMIDLQIKNMLPKMIKRFVNNKKEWNDKQYMRENHRYAYCE